MGLLYLQGFLMGVRHVTAGFLLLVFWRWWFCSSSSFVITGTSFWLHSQLLMLLLVLPGVRSVLLVWILSNWLPVLSGTLD